MKTLTEKKLMEHGWMKAKRRDGGLDWLYPGDMQNPRTYRDACEITAMAYPKLYKIEDGKS